MFTTNFASHVLSSRTVIAILQMSNSERQLSGYESDEDPFSRRIMEMATDKKNEDKMSHDDLINLIVNMRKELAQMKVPNSSNPQPGPSAITDETEESEDDEQDQSDSDHVTDGDANEESNDDLFATYHTQHLRKADHGPPVNANLADLVSTLLTVKADFAKVDELTGNIYRPENITRLRTLKVTDKLWKNLPGNTQLADVKLLEGVRKDADQDTKAMIKPITNKLLDSLQVRILLIT